MMPHDFDPVARAAMQRMAEQEARTGMLDPLGTFGRLHQAMVKTKGMEDGLAQHLAFCFFAISWSEFEQAYNMSVMDILKILIHSNTYCDYFPLMVEHHGLPPLSPPRERQGALQRSEARTMKQMDNQPPTPSPTTLPPPKEQQGQQEQKNWQQQQQQQDILQDTLQGALIQGTQHLQQLVYRPIPHKIVFDRGKLCNNRVLTWLG